MKDSRKPDLSPDNSGDPELTRLFAEQDEAFDAQEFLAPLLAQLESNKKKERLLKGIAIAAGVGALVYGIRELSRSDVWSSVSNVDAWTSEMFSTLDSNTVVSLLASPMSWVVVGAIVATVLPVVYVMRAWR